ncbi:uncharacterized protein L969DRAFT_86056 [Mixia osmundae IAM 14324]|uniref:uncharacterized protein n=1 Tax=Mixia osmundae (strain CBS 9802 / IAM 14324 / JCM 22182 / KY 12970) TaxID=764103 RepID=UPI0004A5582B|nr:uncharacterized protein L969DRAFT_86056 [Mixia osmundae IAM 14324]KEI40829.1 hypothetical protein L969DRAFT_86056 [Mixia osmundae IAM 14324]
MLRQIALSLILARAALAQTNHAIQVGPGLAYTPDNITAAIGDTITFTFFSKNHTVSQSSFAAPCTQLVNATTGAVGFDSGFVPVAQNATEHPAWTVRVQTTAPIWIFCAQTSVSPAVSHSGASVSSCQRSTVRAAWS